MINLAGGAEAPTKTERLLLLWKSSVETSPQSQTLLLLRKSSVENSPQTKTLNQRSSEISWVQVPSPRSSQPPPGRPSASPQPGVAAENQVNVGEVALLFDSPRKRRSTSNNGRSSSASPPANVSQKTQPVCCGAGRTAAGSQSGSKGNEEEEKNRKSCHAAPAATVDYTGQQRHLSEHRFKDQLLLENKSRMLA